MQYTISRYWGDGKTDNEAEVDVKRNFEEIESPKNEFPERRNTERTSELLYYRKTFGTEERRRKNLR